MKKKMVVEGKSTELRQKAERKWQDHQREKGAPSLHEGDLLRLVQELEVHQIELELQQEELVAARAELEVSLNEYSELYDFAPMGYFSLTPESSILRTNLAGARLLGINRSELTNRRFAQFIAYDHRKEFHAFLQKVFTLPSSVHEVCEVALAFETKADVWVRMEAAGAEEGRECRLTVIDITDRKSADQKLLALNASLEMRVQERTADLTQANRQLERANRTKDEFLATMSHELRTPLNSILGMAEVLSEHVYGPLNPRQERSVEIITAGGHHLLELINDILDISKIGVGQMEYHPGLVDVDKICRASLAFVRELSIQKSIKLAYKVEPPAGQIYADPSRLKQILVNLLANAVKFTPNHGQVTLEFTTDEEHERAIFTVIDTGIGIAPADLQRLFEPFVQVDSALNRKFEGSGLGLALVQKLTDMHGGSVVVESEVGTGSRFSIHLPWTRQPPKSGPVPSAEETQANLIHRDPASEAKRAQPVILLAEDSPTNVLTISDYLESHNYEVILADDGRKAIEAAEAHHPDLILMDIQMPNMDGLEAIQRLRVMQQFSSTPIIALTALAMPGDQLRCIKAGATEYMSKPVSLKILVKTINSLLNSTSATN